jgi:hypothetical protein
VCKVQDTLCQHEGDYSIHSLCCFYIWGCGTKGYRDSVLYFIESGGEMADAAAGSSFIHFEPHFRICHETCVVVLVACSSQSPKAAFGRIVQYSILLNHAPHFWTAPLQRTKGRLW